MGDRISVSLARGALYTYASMVLLKAILLINSVVIARWLGPENLGIYSILSQILNFAIAFGLFGLPLAAGRSVAECDRKDKKALETMIPSLLIFSLATAALISALLFAFSGRLAVGVYGEPRLVPLIRIGALAVFISLFGGVLRSVLQGLQKIVVLARLNVAIGVAGAILTLLLVMNFTLTGVVIRDASVAALSAAALAVTLWKVCGSSGLSLSPVFSPASIRSVFVLAWPVFLGSVLMYGGDLFIRSYLVLECGFERAGFFSISDNFFQMVYFIPQAIAMPMLPIITGMHSAEPHNLPRHAASVIKLTGAIALPAATALALASGPAVKFLYGEIYSGSLTVVFLMVFSAAVVAPAYIAGQVLLGAGLGGSILRLSGMQVVFNVCAGYLLIREFGLNGLGVAALLSSLFNYLLSGSHVIRKLGLKPREMRFGTYQLALFTAGLAAYLLIRFSDGAFFAAASTTLVCALAAIQYFYLSDRELELLRRVMPGGKARIVS